jgi:hypothetical protein
MNTCFDGYVLMFVYVGFISVEHLSPGVKVWNGEVWIVCGHV